MHYFANSEGTLVELGVPTHVLDTAYSVLRYEGVLHHIKRLCSIGSVSAEKLTLEKATLRGLSTEHVCVCLTQRGLSEDDPWYLAHSFLKAHALAATPLKNLSVEELVDHYWVLASMPRSLRSKESLRQRSKVLVLPEVTEKLVQGFQESQSAVVARLQDPQVRAQFVAPGVPQGPRMLMSVVVPAGLPYKPRGWELDAFLFSYALRRGNGLLLDLPQLHAEAVRSWIQAGAFEVALVHDDYHEVTQEDTPATLEIAKALWDPQSGTLHSLANAIQAARSLCEEAA